MWNFKVQPLNDGQTQHFRLYHGQAALRYAEALRFWRDDESFRVFFLSLLANAPFKAYRWETPPINTATVGREFEFVLLNEPGLDRVPDAQAFVDQFRSASQPESVLAFPNLGRDAVLVVPCPTGPPSAYGHLAAFIRYAPAAQKHALWQVVGAAMEARLADQRIWLSTAGMGVSWLHVRLDSRPKYYGFRRYAEDT